MPEIQTQPNMHLEPESLTITTSSGEVIKLDPVALFKGERGDEWCVTWAILMRLQALAEYQELNAKMLSELVQSNAQIVQVLSTLAQRSAGPAEDPTEMVTKMMDKLGISADVLKKTIVSTQTPTPDGVEATPINGEDGG